MYSIPYSFPNLIRTHLFYKFKSYRIDLLYFSFKISTIRVGCFKTDYVIIMKYKNSGKSSVSKSVLFETD